MIARPQIPTELGSPLELYMRLMFTELIAAMTRTLRDDELSLAELTALHLCDVRGPIKIGDLGTELLLTMPAASRLVTALVERGLVERRESKTDRRAKTITLSAKGKTLIERISRDRVAEATRSLLAAEGGVSDRFVAFYAGLVEEGLTSSTSKDREQD
jgi:DNA-binding MarR family transcriptional regulator